MRKAAKADGNIMNNKEQQKTRPPKKMMFITVSRPDSKIQYMTLRTILS